MAQLANDSISFWKPWLPITAMRIAKPATRSSKRTARAESLVVTRYDLPPRRRREWRELPDGRGEHLRERVADRQRDFVADGMDAAFDLGMCRTIGAHLFQRVRHAPHRLRIERPSRRIGLGNDGSRG